MPRTMAQCHALGMHRERPRRKCPECRPEFAARYELTGAGRAEVDYPDSVDGWLVDDPHGGRNG